MAKLSGKVSDFLEVGVAAAGRGDLKALRQILKQRPNWHRHIGSHGRTMLWEASHRGKLEVVKFLVDRGSDINACGTYYTPYFVEINCLCAAEKKNRRPVTEFLKSAGAKSNIHMAAFLGRTDEVKRFLSRNRNRINLGHKQHVMAPKNDEGVDSVLRPAAWATPLCYALRGGNSETVEFLLDHGAKVNGFERELFIAADEDFEMVRMLLENGADTTHAPRVTPDDRELYELLSSYGVEISKDEMNRELVYVCRGDRGGSLSAVKSLVDHGADVNAQDEKGKTALHRAAKAGFVETAELLLQYGASVYVRDLKGETPLFDAARATIKNTGRQLAMIELLLAAKADAKTLNDRGQSAADVARRQNVSRKIKVAIGKKRR